MPTVSDTKPTYINLKHLPFGPGRKRNFVGNYMRLECPNRDVIKQSNC